MTRLEKVSMTCVGLAVMVLASLVMKVEHRIDSLAANVSNIQAQIGAAK